MTVLLIALTVTFLVALELLTSRKEGARKPAPARQALRAGAPPAAAPPGPAPSERWVHPGHTWARREAGGFVLAGADELAGRFLGRAAAVRLPFVGDRVRQGETAWTMVSARGRVLHMAAPVDGEVVDVNRALANTPALVQEAPYGAGWAIRIRPARLRESLANLMPDALARAWLDSAKSIVTTRVAPAAGAVATDGGELAPEFGDRLDDASWESLRANLFPARDVSPAVLPWDAFDTTETEWR